MHFQGLNRNRRVWGIILLVVGVILICLIIPPWLWCLIIGIAIIILGIVFTRQR